ncbi:MAG: hypothetical protein HY474_01925 [Candidatus Sungbacteria bacterium]|uniref:Tetratricopeptide repeat protein n=1 Tax=Candidatus Sungiibacteriota bacterium TaxID=2750080 RepID=A0A933DRP4_9BACT|nr:hypothetical protein [Candidatus Sungbacteria bacterium]
MFATLFYQHRNILIGVSAFFILAAIGGAIAWQQYFRVPSETAGILPPPATPSAEPTPPPQALGGTAPAYTGIPVQNLNPSPDILKQVPANTYERSRQELAELAVSLAANPRDADGWMRVAYIKRFYGDYAGAAEAYEYVNRIAEGDGLSFFNLAGLYGYYLKEPAKAIAKYEAALQRDPMNSAYYSSFADFYREVMGDLPAAERVLEQGLMKIPNEINLMISYAALSETMGKVARAIEYYEKVLGVQTGASAAMSAQQRAVIAAEVNRLKAQNP